MTVEIIKVRTIRGGHVFVDRRELDSNRQQLRLYNREGELIQAEFRTIHRENLDPDGSRTAAFNKGLAILGRNFFGYERAGDVRREIKRLKQNLDDYQIIQFRGRWIGHLKSDPMPVE